MKFHALHGVYPIEKKIHRLFVVDLTLDLELKEGAYQDDLNSTVDYQQIFDLTKLVLSESQDLIETIAAKVNSSVLNRFPEVFCSKVKICKTNPPIVGDIEQVCFILESCRN
jgi:dihydroneopterin aldolase